MNIVVYVLWAAIVVSAPAGETTLNRYPLRVFDTSIDCATAKEEVEKGMKDYEVTMHSPPNEDGSEGKEWKEKPPDLGDWYYCVSTLVEVGSP